MRLAVERSVPHYCIGSPRKLDWSQVPTSGITRGWARAIYRVQCEATEWARSLPRPTGDEVAKAEAGADPGPAEGPAVPIPIPAEGPSATIPIPAELLPLLRPPNATKRMGVTLPRFRYVYYCKQRDFYGFSVPAADGKPQRNGSPFASDLDAAWALYRAVGGCIPPTKSERQKRTRAAVAIQHHGPRNYGWGKTTNSKGVYRTTTGRYIGKFKVGNRTYNAGTYDSEGEASAAVAARRRDLAAGEKATS